MSNLIEILSSYLDTSPNPYNLDKNEYDLLDKAMRSTNLEDLTDQEWTMFKSVIKKVNL